MMGSWIFLSHSSNDISIIRRIRNEFELCGHNPLAFHLKCLNDSTAKGKYEIISLIEREIDSRDWFVYCNSKSSKESLYVQLEREYVQKSNKKVFEIDVYDDWEVLKAKIHQISKDLSIYVSFVQDDAIYGHNLIKQLKQRDFTVYSDADTMKDESDHYTDSIIYGFELFIVTNNSLERLYKELDYILNCCNGGETLIPIFIGEVQMNDETDSWLRSSIHFDIENDDNIDFSKVVDCLEKSILNRINRI